jgi:hypothetical protein
LEQPIIFKNDDLIKQEKEALNAYLENSACKSLSLNLINYFRFLNNKATDREIVNHGESLNRLSGGTCADLMKINNRSKCCEERNDNCFIIHYDTRCYCDSFCENDCCSDALINCRD